MRKMAKSENNKYKIKIKDIKSSSIKKILISFLSKEQLLELISYNKELQKMLLVDIKKNSRKIKIAEKNGKWKEYLKNTNIIIFEGEYLNGKRNGKGKEYYDDSELKFKGEYLNGKRNGIGKEYLRKTNIIIFEGEYLNGKRNGKGKEYYDDGEIKFKGEYLNGKRNGIGK